MKERAEAEALLLEHGLKHKKETIISYIKEANYIGSCLSEHTKYTMKHQLMAVKHRAAKIQLSCMKGHMIRM